MFTGIVRELGRVASTEGGAEGVRLTLEAPATAPTSGVGDSVSVSGVCLTVATVEADRLSFHAVPETLSRSTLGALSAGDHVNLEPAVRAGDPLGGHYVQGHVDAVGRVQSVEAEGEDLRVFVEAPDDVLRYCVEKGSIAVDGVSLTVSRVDERTLDVSLIPETLERTTLGAAKPGRTVNLEVDIVAKYVEKLVGASR